MPHSAGEGFELIFETERASFFFHTILLLCLLVAQMVMRLPAMQETRVWSLGWEDPLEKEMATHSSTLAWKIPRTKEPGRLQSMGSQRVRHDWATAHTYIHTLYLRGLCCAQPLQSCLTLWDPMDHSPPGSSVHGILQARIQEWIAMPSRGASRPRNRTRVSYVSGIADGFFTHWATWEAFKTITSI